MPPATAGTPPAQNRRRTSSGSGRKSCSRPAPKIPAHAFDAGSSEPSAPRLPDGAASVPLVPVWPGRDVSQLRLEEVLVERHLIVVHLREDLARGLWANAVNGLGDDRLPAVHGNEIRGLADAGERLLLIHVAGRVHL